MVQEVNQKRIEKCKKEYWNIKEGKDVNKKKKRK